MKPFNIVNGKAAPLLAANIDTDVIMPKQFLKGIDRQGLDHGVFFDQRFLTSGEPNPDFILNQSEWQESTFLVVGPNFGCGSSREHAVWGLKQLGIRALIGTTFAGIFYDNCQRNGVLIIQLPENSLLELGQVISNAKSNEIQINLQEQQIKLKDNSVTHFDIDHLRKTALLEGLDAVGSTLQRKELIDHFEHKYLKTNPWLQ
ncbi:MAG: 3-isopropylmalate dehydratase small subunit [Amphritea sp.]